MWGFFERNLRALLARRRIALAEKRAADVRAILSGDAIVLLDVGASGGVIPRWSPFRADIAFVGVEPDARSVSALLNSPESQSFRSYEIVPFGAWNRTGAVSISFTRKPMCSSHFSPNIPFLSRFKEAERFDIVGSTEVECRTIDDLLSGSGKAVDFIKLDLEGGELAVLEGATKSIEGCMGFHVEVCFQSIRESQPLFGDIKNFLMLRGIEFVDFVALIRWERDSFRGLGQAIFGDALFLRAPENVVALAGENGLTARRARSYVAILVIYERFDLATRFIELLRKGVPVLDENELTRLAAIVGRRKAMFDRHYRWVSLFGQAFSHYAGENFSLHLIY
jgi:FkbM family methyltransferase